VETNEEGQYNKTHLKKKKKKNRQQTTKETNL
jgi:hypothetical protein